MTNPRKIEVVAYNPRWPELFKQEAARLCQALGHHLKEIHHIGSTSIPNMPAKPVIDMMLVFEDLSEIDWIAKKLIELNYQNVRRQIIPHRSFFTHRQDPDIRFHLHIHERGSPQIKRHVNFRDYVIEHPEDANAYAALKMDLAKRFPEDIYNYVVGKDKLVQSIDAKAKKWEGRKVDYLTPNTGPLASKWSNEKLVKAMVTNYNTYMTHFAQYLNQIELLRIPGFTIVNTGLADATFNYVLDADFSSAEADNKIAEVTQYFLKKNVPFSWWISPYDQPDELAMCLERHGYHNAENHSAMYFDLDAWDEHIADIPELEIVPAKDEKTLQDFALVSSRNEYAFKQYFSWVASVYTEDDPIEFYVGYVEGKPIVRGLSCYFAQVTGLYWLTDASTKQSIDYTIAMQRYQLKRAKELGYHVAVSHASRETYDLYVQLGYEECEIFRELKRKYNN